MEPVAWSNGGTWISIIDGIMMALIHCPCHVAQHHIVNSASAGGVCHSCGSSLNHSTYGRYFALPLVLIDCMAGRKKLLCGGGGVTRRPIFPTPRPPSLAAVTGGGVQGGGARPAVPGGGVNPTSMAQNDTHVALIILTTQMWGGGGIIGGKNFFGPKFVFLRLRRQHPFLHKTKGPTRNPISPTPPPLLRQASMSPLPPPQSNFQVAYIQT